MRQLSIEKIETSIQPRYRMDQSTIEEYAAAMKGGAKFPPVEVVAEKGSERFILIDGHHRLHAAMSLGLDKLGVKVHQGDKARALELALRANSSHGLRRSNADKRKVVLLAMSEPSFDKLSLRDLADLCQVSHEFVRAIKQEINEKAEQMDDPEQPLNKKGKKDKPKLTPEEVDRNELREFFAFVKSFPFDGAKAAESIPFEDDDYEAMEFVRDWLNEALAVNR